VQLITKIIKYRIGIEIMDTSPHVQSDYFYYERPWFISTAFALGHSATALMENTVKKNYILL
jgi:hypothetical protein